MIARTKKKKRRFILLPKKEDSGPSKVKGNRLVPLVILLLVAGWRDETLQANHQERQSKVTGRPGGK